MNLSNYITDLLYRYECVIVPKFGGFVANEMSARIDRDRQLCHPPYKQISFNGQLTQNDGLLANYIASTDKISYECAMNYIQFEIDSWKEKMDAQDLSLNGLGTLGKENGKYVFEPENRVNYLTSSFGLSSVVALEIEREEPIKPAQAAPKVIPIVEKEERKIPSYLKYAAALVLGLSLAGVGTKYYKNFRQDQYLLEAQQNQQQVERKIENATFVVAKPLPALSIELPVANQRYHVIAGAFRFPENAERKLDQLRQKGFDARILGVNKWNLTIVSYGSYSTREEALGQLGKIRVEEAKDSWLLIQDF